MTRIVIKPQPGDIKRGATDSEKIIALLQRIADALEKKP